MIGIYSAPLDFMTMYWGEGWVLDEHRNVLTVTKSLKMLEGFVDIEVFIHHHKQIFSWQPLR